MNFSMFFSTVITYFVSYLFFTATLTLVTILIGVGGSPVPHQKSFGRNSPECNAEDKFHQNQMQHLKNNLKHLRNDVSIAELQCAQYDSQIYKYSILTKLKMPAKYHTLDTTSVSLSIFFIFIKFTRQY